MDTKQITNRIYSSDAASRELGFRAAILKAQQGVTRVLSGDAFEAPDSASTAAAYRVDRTAGAVLIDGVTKIVTVDDNRLLIDASPDVPSYDTDGVAAVVLAATPGLSRACSIVQYLDTAGDMQEVAIFGGIATDYEEAVAPTAAECRAAMIAVGLDWDHFNGLIVGRTTFGMAAQTTITIGAGVAENDQFEATVGLIVCDVTADGDDDEEDVAGKLKVELEAALTLEPVTVTVTGAAIKLSWDAGEEPPALDLDNGASAATMIAATVGTIWQTVVNPTSDVDLLGARSAGSLFEE